MNDWCGAALFAALVTAAPVWADGATLFEDNCVACHAAGGVGTPGLAPPLVDEALWDRLGPRAPDYVAGVLAAGLTGRITAGGMDYIGLAMPAQEHLTDDEAAEVATYVLQSFAGLGAAATPDQIATARATPPTHADLRKIRKGE